MGGEVDSAATNGFSFGDSALTSGANAISFGRFASASGDSASAFGNGAVATGINSNTLGGGFASGENAVALHFGNATGNNSFAWSGDATGLNSASIGGISAAGESSMALMGGVASASESFALGNNSVSQGENSYTLGTNINAYSYAETVFGFNEIPYTPVSTSTSNANDRLFVVANGNGAPSLPIDNNAFTILKDGRTGIMRIPTTNILEVNGNASKTVAGDWLANSDARLKTNISTFNETKALNKLLQMRGVTYEWDDNQTGNNRPEGQQYGFIAQELQEVFPENVSLDNQGFYQTAYGTYDALYVQSIKALNTKIENLEKENNELKLKLNELCNLVEKHFQEN
jgi:hypothetical protein